MPTWAVTLGPAAPKVRAPLLARLGPRVRAYVEAFAAVGPRRAPCPPGGQQAWAFFSVMAEPLFHNARITLPMGGQVGGGEGEPRRLLRPEDLPPGARPQPGAAAGWRHLRDVRAAMCAGPPSGGPTAAVDVVLAAVPPEWRAELGRERDPAPDWWCVAAGDGQRYAWPIPGPGEPGPGAVGFDAPCLMRADALGRLVPIVPASRDGTPMEELPEDATEQLLAAKAVVVAAAAAWRPAAVVPRPTSRPRWTLRDVARQEEYLCQKEEAAAMGEPAPPAPLTPTERWLLGPWDELELDPTTWAVGTDTLCGYTAKAGRQWAWLHAACKADPHQRAELGWRPMPKLWPRPQQQGEDGRAEGLAGHLTQLAEEERRWVRSCQSREAAPPGRRQAQGGGASGRSRRGGGTGRSLAGTARGDAASPGGG